MLFPEFAGFRVALKSMKDWEDKRAVYLLLEPVFIPVGISIVNRYKGRSFGWWGMRIGVLSVTTINSVVFPCSEGKEKSLDGLLNTR